MLTEYQRCPYKFSKAIQWRLCNTANWFTGVKSGSGNSMKQPLYQPGPVSLVSIQLVLLSYNFVFCLFSPLFTGDIRFTGVFLGIILSNMIDNRWMVQGSYNMNNAHTRTSNGGEFLLVLYGCVVAAIPRDNTWGSAIHGYVCGYDSYYLESSLMGLCSTPSSTISLYALVFFVSWASNIDSFSNKTLLTSVINM